MSRRQALQWLGSSALLSACGSAPRVSSLAQAPPHNTEAAGIAAVAFDLFTLFDPRGIDARVAEVVGANAAFAATWKTRLFEYCWLRAAAENYADFEALIHAALTYAARAHAVTLTDSSRAQLASVFSQLEPWPDTRGTLGELKARGLKLAPLANFTPRMIDALLAQAGLRQSFDFSISTDEARSYKPDPRAYALGERRFGLSRQHIAFAAFGGWDAAGARWFGFPTFWVNRLGVAPDELVAADATGPDLTALAAWLASRA